ncbi:MAG: hypothetical protein ACAI43_09975 [Phycisphaerae bacterium]
MNQGMIQATFQVRTRAPMTAAERQRRCRENGKGRHRGERGTRADSRAALARVLADAAAAEAAARAPAAPHPVAVAVAVESPADGDHLNLSAMAA